MNEIKQKRTLKLNNYSDETQKLSTTGSFFNKKTLNIDLRIKNIKKIMKENEVLSLIKIFI